MREPTRGERGRFESFLNGRARTPSQDDKALVRQITDVVTGWSPHHEVRWAGSIRNGTAIRGSDLDLWVSPKSGAAAQISKVDRRHLADAMKRRLQREVQVRSHVIHIPGNRRTPGADVSFVDATFGGRPLPSRDQAFKGRPPRQGAARAIKLWAEEARLSEPPGWIVETLVLAVDDSAPAAHALDLFLTSLCWITETTGTHLEELLRPHAHPRWDPAWSERLQGPLEAFQNDARRLLRAWSKGTSWRNDADVATWLSR